ncbi:SMI1/KNR4 family protein [Allonocardiopsis opalescens]|uniref:SUKH-3 immunity protein of toxin-antitoxin system n=1 Tax=Allonocardiopsis opalescens TaxID=1144618 RepID=A0A2T0QD56_9ACTN|nr:SMI1/KNR4 family protein [Allonocardiopsis opalescens]PRY01838.1 hypothetical protein CLV72_101435 [Allonocardiopsis opalescens]
MSTSSTAVDELMDVLVAGGLISAEGVRGCTGDEVARMLATNPSVDPPQEYIDFLRRPGRGAGRVLRGTSIFYPESLEAHDGAIELAEVDVPDFRVRDRFFIGHHQGDIHHFFEKDDPRPWAYVEGKDRSVVESDSMSGLLRMDVESLRERERAARDRRRS